MVKEERRSGFELLRIIAMLMIITSHCIGAINPGQYFNGNLLSTELLYLLQTLSVAGTNIFVMISGYFMVERRKVSVRKVVELILEVAFYGILETIPNIV